MRKSAPFRRVAGAILTALAVGVLVAFVVASVLGMNSIQTVLQQWIFWLLWGSIGLGLLVRGLVRLRRSESASRSELDLSEVNAIYLGRAPSTQVVTSVDDYSAYPKNQSEGREPDMGGD